MKTFESNTIKFIYCPSGNAGSYSMTGAKTFTNISWCLCHTSFLEWRLISDGGVRNLFLKRLDRNMMNGRFFFIYYVPTVYNSIKKAL